MPLPAEVEVVVGAPFLYLDMARKTLNPYFGVSAQNCWTKKGAFTGEIAPEMLKDIGINWVILGHSERRHFTTYISSHSNKRHVIGETDALIAEKTKVAIGLGIHVIACIGETEKERVDSKTTEVVATQMAALAKAINDWSKGTLAVLLFY